MSDYFIRLYKDSDYAAARDLFAGGITEHSRTCFYHALGLPHIWLPVMAVFILVLNVVSVTVSILVAAMAIACVWFVARYMYTAYVQYALSDDMLDIQKYYLQREGYCFWVAELAGEVVGTVAAVPSSDTGGEKHLEMKRLSVSKQHRGKGIAKMLCWTMIEFARKRGGEAVVLTTTVLQIDAWRMYEKMGFRQTRNYYPPNILDNNMSDYRIRLYKDSDYAAVRDIFACGIIEHTGTAFYHALSLPHIWAFYLLMFLLLLQTTGSFIISIVAVAIAIAILWLINRHIYTSYVKRSLAEDMLDIRKYYLQREGYCFWVAESAGEVVGMVAAVPPHHPGGEKEMELKRLSIPKKHRGKGIAKALCGTAVEFARKGGCEAVILETSLFQIDACRLYEKMGFRRTHTSYAPHSVAKLIGFILLFYQYDIPIHQ